MGGSRIDDIKDVLAWEGIALLYVVVVAGPFVLLGILDLARPPRPAPAGRDQAARAELGLLANAVLRRNIRLVIVNLMVQYPTTVDRAFAALADPTRRAVLERLGSGRATISELAEPFGMSLTGMKKHIRLLEEAELVTTEKVGRVRRCMLAPYAFEGISTWLQRLDRFAQVVERTKGAR